MLGIPVVPISAAKNEGVDELVDHALHVARFDEAPVRVSTSVPQARKSTTRSARCTAASTPSGAHHRAVRRAGVRHPRAFCRHEAGRGRRARSLDKLRPAGIRRLDGAASTIVPPDGGRAPVWTREAAHGRHALRLPRRTCATSTVVKPARKPRAQAQRFASTSLLTGRFTGYPVRFSPSWRAVFVAHVQLRGRRTFRPGEHSASTRAPGGAGRRLRGVGSSTPWRNRCVVDGIGRRRGQRCIGFLPTIVTLFFFLSHSGGLGLHGARGVRHGQAPCARSACPGALSCRMLMGFGCTVPADHGHAHAVERNATAK